MARPRQHSDDDLLGRVAASLAEAPASWSLADAARAAGVHPATLVKRFGSKHGLLVELSRRWSASIRDVPDTDDPLAELHGWADGVDEVPPDRSRGVNGLAMLLEDLKDDELSELLRHGWSRQARYLGALITAAARDGRLPRAPDPEVGGFLLLDVLHGAYLRAAAGSRHPTTRTQIRTLLESWT